ncbi:hypothetical protein ACFQ0M_49090 [Kitasatospora aburaviensis]
MRVVVPEEPELLELEDSAMPKKARRRPITGPRLLLAELLGLLTGALGGLGRLADRLHPAR